MSRFLVVTYNVTDLTEDQISGLAGEALVQAEAHPGVGAVSGTFTAGDVDVFVGLFTDADPSIEITASAQPWLPSASLTST